MDFDLVGHVETFGEDAAYAAAAGNIAGLANLALDVAINRKTARSDETALEYFRALSGRQRQKLLELYRLDFEMFGYDPAPFMGNE